MNIEANRTLFIIGINYLLFPGRGWAFRLADARGALRPGQNNNRMAVYRSRRPCRNFHTPQLRVCLFSIGAEITRSPKERL